MQGIAEAESTGTVFRYTCRARSRLEEVLEVRLPGVGKVSGSDAFTHELIIPPSKQPALRRALQVTPVPISPRDGAHPLAFKIVFEPLKTLVATVRGHLSCV